MKKIFLLFFILFIAASCSSGNNVPLDESNFPLDNHITVPIVGNVREIAVAGTWIAVDTGDKIVALDPGSGSVMWSIDFPVIAYTQGFLVSGDTLIAASSTEVISVDKNGRNREFALDSGVKNITRLTSVYPDYLYIVGHSWMFGAYDILNGDLMWETPVGRGGGDEAYYDNPSGLVFVSGGSIRAFDHRTGKLEWIQDRNVISSAFASRVLYEYEKVNRNNNYRVNAVDIGSKNDLWSRDFTFLPATGVNKLAVSENLVLLIGSDIIALDVSTGNQIWKTSTGETFYTSPVYFDGALYIKAGGGNVYAISPIDGSIIGKVTVQNNDLLSGDDARSGVYKISNGIVFNTRNSIEIYSEK